MSCWVVPALAADYWKISLDELMAAIRGGRVVTKVEHGFTFVDVQPGSAAFVLKPRHKSVGSPLTYVALTRQEIEALTADLEVAPEQNDDGPLDEEETPLDRPAFGSFAWAEARQQAGQRRVAPRRAVA